MTFPRLNYWPASANYFLGPNARGVDRRLVNVPIPPGLRGDVPGTSAYPRISEVSGGPMPITYHAHPSYDAPHLAGMVYPYQSSPMPPREAGGPLYLDGRLVPAPATLRHEPCGPCGGPQEAGAAYAPTVLAFDPGDYMALLWGTAPAYSRTRGYGVGQLIQEAGAPELAELTGGASMMVPRSQTVEELPEMIIQGGGPDLPPPTTIPKDKPEPKKAGAPWGWILGGSAAALAIGGVIYFAMQPKRRANPRRRLRRRANPQKKKRLTRRRYRRA